MVLPINPQQLELTEEQLNEKTNLLNIGEVNLLGRRGLIKGPISSFFPSALSPFYRYANREPQEYVQQLQKWKRSGKPIRLIVSDLDLNLMMSIDKLSIRQNEGDQDIYYTLELAEYRKLNVATVQVDTVIPKSTSGLAERPNTQTTPQTVTVKSAADTLWAIACKYYGDGAKWTVLAEASGITDPRKMQIGDKVVIP